jgi:hypothetical protein
MPNLTHLAAPLDALHRGRPASILARFGQQLEVIELLDTQTYRTWIYNSDPIPGCPNLNTLKYSLNYINYIIYTKLPPSLQNIVLRINSRLHDDEVLERCLPQHFDALTGPAFPALRRVVLDGIDTPFHPGYTVMRRRFPVQRVDGMSIVWEC